jgi:hypothetical protein
VRCTSNVSWGTVTSLGRSAGRRWALQSRRTCPGSTLLWALDRDRDRRRNQACLQVAVGLE